MIAAAFINLGAYNFHIDFIIRPDATATKYKLIFKNSLSLPHHIDSNPQREIQIHRFNITDPGDTDWNVAWGEKCYCGSS